MSKLSAFILAAGEGRRLRPATLVRAKALLPFCGIPLLELIAFKLNLLPIDNLIVNTCYQGDRVTEFCHRLEDKYSWNLLVSQESKLLNHGGGIRKGLQLSPDSEHILVHNVDIIADFNLSVLLDMHLQNDAAATALLIPGKGPQSVSLTAEGKIHKFRDPDNGTHTFSGIHIFRRDILDLLPDNEDAPDIVSCYQNALDLGWNIQACCAEENTFWSDIGTAADYIKAHGEIADCALSYDPLLQKAQTEQARRRFELELKGVECSGALGLGLELGVPAGSQLHNVVLWDYTRLPRPLLYADGIFTGDDVAPPKSVSAQLKPDKRLIKSLNFNEESYKLTELPKQGSGRRFCRLSNDKKSFVWCAYNPERRENSGYAAISDFLSRLGIRVPNIILHQPDSCEIIIEDLGQSDMQLFSDKLLKEYLFQTVEQIARLHVLGDQAVRLEELPLQKGFTKGLYDWERDYFRSNILENFLSASHLWAAVANEYKDLRNLLLREPLVPIHRDLQSANIKILNGQVWLIDFQGMRLGAAAYDIASLLYDPYQCHPIELRNQVWQEYCKQVKNLGSTAFSEQILHAAACQRLLQALGAYGKLWLEDGLDWYKQFIIPGFTMLKEAAKAYSDFPQMEKFAEKCLQKSKEKITC